MPKIFKIYFIVYQCLKSRTAIILEGKWKVWVTTNELPSAGTRAQVSITVYGHKGNSGLLTLESTNGEHFQAGSIDEFEVVS